MAASTMEDVVREVGGRPDGARGVLRALLALVFGAIRDGKVKGPRRALELIRAGKQEDIRGFLALNDQMAEDEPDKVARRSDGEKVILYTLLAAASGGAAKPGRRPPVEGYAIGALTALERIRLAEIGSAHEQAMARAELFGGFRQAASGEPNLELPTDGPGPLAPEDSRPAVHVSEGPAGRGPSRADLRRELDEMRADRERSAADLAEMREMLEAERAARERAEAEAREAAMLLEQMGAASPEAPAPSAEPGPSSPSSPAEPEKRGGKRKS